MEIFYTTRQQVELLLSRYGAMTFADDNRDGIAEPDVWNMILGEASREVDLYLTRWYSPQDMKNNRWIKYITTWIAAYLLTLRRGNPGLFKGRYEMIISWLERIFTGIMQVPDLAWKEDLSPSLSNMVVDDRFQIAKVRVQPGVSTGGKSSRQHADPMQGWELL